MTEEPQYLYILEGRTPGSWMVWRYVLVRETPSRYSVKMRGTTKWFDKRTHRGFHDMETLTTYLRQMKARALADAERAVARYSSPIDVPVHFVPTEQEKTEPQELIL